MNENVRRRTFPRAGGLLLLFTATVAGAPTALADEPRPEHYDFDDDLVEGDLVRPDGIILQARTRSSRTSLIRCRDNFVAELYASVEDV
jgi:hypothetical protein